MTTFPTLYPDSIAFSQGLPQVSEFTSFGVGPIRFRHNNFINGQRFTFEYLNLQQTSVEAIRDHYLQSQGTAGRFLIPSAIFGSVNVTDSASLFRYVETPAEEHFGVYFNVSVTIEAVTGLELLFHLDGGPATLPAEEAFSKFVFDGTAPFILNGSDPSLATLTLNAD